MAEVNPKTECPKKGKMKTDSSAVLEEEETMPASEYDLKHNGIQEEFVTYKKPSTTNSENTLVLSQVSDEAETMDEDVDSPLSFNFVYYIFEKFKFSSSVEP